MADTTLPINIEGVRAFISDQFDRELHDADIIDFERAQSIEPAKHIDDFIYVLDKIIKFETKISNLQYLPYMTTEYPEADAFMDIFDPSKTTNDVGTQYTDVVQYRLLKRRPGSFQRTSKPMAAGNVREYAPRFRYYTEDKENPGYRMMIYGQLYDNLIELVCWARTSKRANQTAFWLEEIIEKYKYVFLVAGFVHVRYEGRDTDRVYINNSKNIRIAGRPLTFYVRNEKIIVRREKVLEDIILELGLRRVP